MRQYSRITLPLLLKLLLLTLPCHATQTENTVGNMTDYYFPEKMTWKLLTGKSGQQPLNNDEAVQDYLQTAGFDITNTTVTPKRIAATLTLTHTGKQSFKLIVSPCGGAPFPYGGSSPFLLQVDYSDKITQDAIRYAGLLYPPAPPPPAMLEIPARSRTHFTANIDLTSYTYQGTPEIKLRWFFCIYGSPAVQGTFSAKLPAD